MPRPAPTPPPRAKTPAELLREARNTAVVAVVSSGFQAIDELCEMGKDRIKRALIEAISGKKATP